ncbi:MAG: DUF4229 domain-containing protein [Marmoricola sp.]
MKAFVVYTVLRILLFVACYAVLAGIWVLVGGNSSSAFVWPFVGAAVISSLLSLRLLNGPRERFAASVQARAERATARFEEMRSSEDADQGA